MLIAHVSFYKEVEKDNYEKGCYGSRSLIFNEEFTVNFKDTDDFKQQLASYTSTLFDVNEGHFIKWVENECENNRFDYAQNEDEEGNHIEITSENPDGYYAVYSYYINKVTEQIVDYKF